MKIAQINQYFYPVLGGLEYYVYYISKELVKRGHEIHVFTLDKRNNKKLGPKEEILDGIFVHRLPILLEMSYRLKVWPSLVKELRKQKFDIIHSHAHGHFHSIISSLYGKIRKIPNVLTVYGPLILHRDYNALEKIYLKLFDFFISPIIFKYADLLLIRDPNIKSWLISLGVSPNRIKEGPSGIPDECLKQFDGKVFKQKYGIKRKIVLYVGRINPQKGVQYLVRAAPLVLKDCPDVKFVLIGPDELGYTVYLKKLAKKLRIEENIMFLGPISILREEMEAFASADAFVMPSIYEGFSQTILKALSQGTAVIASNVGAIPYYWGDVVLLYEFHNIEELATLISDVLTGDMKNSNFAEKIRRNVLKFTFKNLARELERMYVDIIE